MNAKLLAKEEAKMGIVEYQELHIWALEMLVDEMREVEENEAVAKKDHHRSRAEVFREVIEKLEEMKP